MKPIIVFGKADVTSKILMKSCFKLKTKQSLYISKDLQSVLQTIFKLSTNEKNKIYFVESINEINLLEDIVKANDNKHFVISSETIDNTIAVEFLNVSDLDNYDVISFNRLLVYYANIITAQIQVNFIPENAKIKEGKALKKAFQQYIDLQYSKIDAIRLQNMRNITITDAIQVSC